MDDDMDSQVDIILQPYGSAVYDTRRKCFFILNETATRILEKLRDLPQIEQIVDVIYSEFNASKSSIRKDTESFLLILESFGIGREAIRTNSRTLGSKSALSIIVAELELTQRCSFACRYCAVGASPKGKQGITVNHWVKIVKKLISKNVREITLTGGDPLESHAFWPILKLLSESGVYASVYANGNKINEEFISRLKRLDFLDKVTVQISLDSTVRETNDRYRGVGSYDTAMRAIRCLVSHNIPTGVASIVFPDTINDLEDTLWIWCQQRRTG